MHGSVFSLEKDVPVFLYGENDFAMHTFACLKKRGYRAEGIIDQKYDCPCEQDGVRRLGLRDLEGWGQLKETIVVICLKNGMLHDRTADSLYNMGVRKIIYLPMKTRNSLEYRKSCRAAWRHVWSFAYEKIGAVPCYSMEESPLMVIAEEERQVSFWCPKEYLRSVTREMIQRDVPENLKSARAELGAYADVSIEEHRPYIELFKWLAGEAADIALYLKAMGRTTDLEQEKLLLDRKELYAVYEQALRYDIGFFTESPAQVSWNCAGGYSMWWTGCTESSFCIKKDIGKCLL